MSKKFYGWIFFLILFCAGSVQAAVSIKQRQDCEVLTTKGWLLSQKDGRELWRSALEIWPGCYLAQEALGISLLQSGNFAEALERLEEAQKTSPPFRRPFYDFHKARAQMGLGQDEAASELLHAFLENEKSFFLTAPQPNLLAQAHYLLGLMEYRRENHVLALKHFEDALDLLTSLEDDLAQSLHYYTGEIYARFHMRRHAITHLRDAEMGPSPVLRRTAWLVHSHLNEWSWAGRAGLFLRHDSNPILFSAGESLPPEISSQSTQGVEPFLNLQVQSSHAQKFGVGASFASDAIMQITNSYNFANSLLLSPSLWGRYWDRENFECQLGYAFHQTRLGRTYNHVLENFHQARFSFSLFPKETRLRWNLDLSVGLRDFPFEISVKNTMNDRSAQVVSARTRIGLETRTWFEPFVGHGFFYVHAKGSEFSEYTHLFELGMQSSPFSRFSFSAAASYQRAKFFSSVLNRSDQIFQGQISARLKLTDLAALVTDASLRHALSNVERFRYDQAVVRLGMEFLF